MSESGLCNSALYVKCMNIVYLASRRRECNRPVSK